VGGPLLLSTIITLAFGTDPGIDATIGVVDADGSPVSTGFTRALAGAGEGGLEFSAVDTAEAARAEVDGGDLAAAVVVPAGFGASLTGDRPAALEVLTSPDALLGGQIARAVARTFAARVDAARLAAATTVAEGGPPPSTAQLAAVELPIAVDRRGSTGEVSPAAYFGPSMGLLFLFLSIGVVARGLLDEKRRRVLDRMRVAPVGAAAILAGKCLSAVVASAAGLGVIWLATAVALGADWGDPAGVALLAVAAALAVAGIAGLVAALARTDQSAETFATMAAFTMALVGGNFVPLGAMPDALRTLSLASPNGWALHGFAELSAGEGSVVDVLPHAGVLLAWAVVTGGLAARLLPARLEAR